MKRKKQPTDGDQLAAYAVREMRDWQIVHGDVRNKPEIAGEMMLFMGGHGVKSVAISDGLMGCPHQWASGHGAGVQALSAA